MAKRLVIAYFMHEWERDAAERMISAAETTDSFVMGEMEDADIETAKRDGLIIQTVEPPIAAPAEPQRPQVDAAAMMMESLGVDLDTAVPAAQDYYDIRLRGPVIESRRQQLRAAGIQLLEWDAEGQGYKAFLSSQQVATANAFDFVESVTWISPKRSVPAVTTRSVAPLLGETLQVKMLTFDVRLNRPDDGQKVQQWLKDHNIVLAGASGRKIRFYAVENDPLLGQLALLPEVDTVAEYVVPEAFNDASRRLLGIDGQPGSNPATYLAQDGSGQVIAVADTGIDDTHADFQGRIAGKVARGRPGNSSDPAGHGTHVAGSVLGDGAASGGQIKGTAPKAQLFFQSLLDANGKLGGLPLDLNDLFDEAYQAGARIHNNSWGASTPSTYTFNSEEVDEFVRGHPDMLVLVAAGNAGNAANPTMRPRRSSVGFVDWLSIGSPASSKNALTVGASRSDRANGPMAKVTWKSAWPNLFPDPPIAADTVSGNPDCMAAFSSRGPCDDRRIKPDLVAPGTDILSTRSALAPLSNFWGAYPANAKYAFDGGTSMATPLVAGCAGLVRQYYIDDRQHQPSAALLKATLVNSTAWLSGADSIAPTAGKPNYHQGHGRVCMKLAIPNPSEPGLQLQFVDNWQDAPSHFTLTGQRKRYQFVLPKQTDLRVTMAYTDTPARALQNNVNLMINHIESGTKWMGNQDLPDALTLPDPDNNVERVRIDNAPAGTYFIQVFVGNMLKAPQDFALVVTGVGVPALNEV
jgi:serine protease AprX